MDESPPPSRISAAELDRFTLDLGSFGGVAVTVVFVVNVCSEGAMTGESRSESTEKAKEKRRDD